jgi:hypothetical protein
MAALQCARRFGAVICIVALAACSNGRGSVDEGEQQTEGFTVGGAVSGLSGAGLVLQLNGAGDLTVPGNGAFTFTGSLSNGASYDVTIRSQPTNPAQTCNVTSGAGRIAGGNVSNVAVVCATGSTAFSVGGSVTGLTGSGLILRLNGTHDLPISADGDFIFPVDVATGTAYNVRVGAAPSNPAQTCTVENADGVMADVDVTNVRVVCSVSAFSVGGVVSGLTGAGLLLRLNGAEDLGVGADGRFTFQTRVASGAQYAVTVARQPTGQTCSIPNGAGTVGGADVADVAVNCAVDAYAVGGEVKGLAPTQNARVTLRLTAGAQATNHIVRRNGPFEFPVAVPNGTGYVVTVQQQPTNPSQLCEVANGTGIVMGAAVNNVVVTCTTQRYTVGGNVNGLQPGSSGLVLRLNGAQDLPIAGNGTFVFDEPLLSGEQYTVSVAANPPNPPQTCTPTGHTGTIGGQNVRNVVITCALDTYPVGGAVTGLASGARVVLQMNGGETVEVVGSSSFTFPTRIATGGSYSVTVQTQPAGHSCTMENGAGTVGTAAVTNIGVRCQPVYTIGGTISGLTGAGFVLRNGDATLAVPANATSFQFPQAFQTGQTYSVSVATNPSTPTQTCSVAGGDGTIGNSNVTTIAVTCTTNSYSIGGSVSGLIGVDLQLQNNGGDTITIMSNGGFTFPTPVPSGQPYSVIVSRQPTPLPFLPQQTCVVASGGGTVGAGNVVDVAVTCR